jgi:predicted transcriptional regulator
MSAGLNALSTLARLDDISCFDVVRCIFNLTQTDITVLTFIPENGNMTASAIGGAIGKDRSTAYRSLEKLVACGICNKERKAGERRGYVYEYHRIPDKELYRKTMENLDKCYAKVRTALGELEKP